MQLLPEKYDQLELSPNDKSIVKVFERAFKGNESAYFVLKINPRKIGIKDDETKPELFHLLVVEEGIVLFRLFEIDDAGTALATINAWSQYGLYDALKEDIEKKLEGSNYLVDDSGELMFDLSIRLLFPQIRRFDVMGADSNFLHGACLLCEDIQQIKDNGAKSVLALLSSKEKAIAENDVNNIFQRLCPEITIPRKYFLNENQTVYGVDGNVTEGDASVRAYRLHPSQVNYINRIGKGNQLILACAGSGKSVLLISKCFKLASLNPAEDFLIACYNQNLRTYYEWAVGMAGFRARGKVRVNSFYQLCKQLLIESGITPNNFSDLDARFRGWFDQANTALEKKQIKKRFYGIFIDEIQIFKPEWYRFCYNLLKSKNETDHYFVIAGDKSQDIKSHMSKGRAPWQGHGDNYPKYSGHTLAIETNYRNSKPINDAIDKFVERAKEKGLTLGVDISSDPELFLRGTSIQKGHEPAIIENSDAIGESAEIVKELKYLIEAKEYSETDIAVIFYNMPRGAEQELIAAFIREGWQEPSLLYGESDRGSYGSRRGITLAKVEGALGLDYTAVVLAGLSPLGKQGKGKNGVVWRHQAKVDADFAGLSEEDKKQRFLDNVKILYTGCTRAKESLSVILSLEKGQCIYSDLLRSSITGRRR